MKKALIIASGNIGDLSQLKEEIHGHDYILCADGGVRHIYTMNIKVDSVIGDLDSVDDYLIEFIRKNHIPIIKFPIEKDETDTELAVSHLIEKGFDQITLMGVTGTRMDHTMANILLLKRLSRNNIKAKIIDGNNKIILVDNYVKISRKKDYYISIIPISSSGVVVTLKGFYYPLDSSLIEYGSTLGISNWIVEGTGEIFIEKGQALIFESRD